MTALPNPAQDMMRQIEATPIMNNAFASWLKTLDKTSRDVISISMERDTQRKISNSPWVEHEFTGFTTVTLTFSDSSTSVQVFNMNWEPQLKMLAE